MANTEKIRNLVKSTSKKVNKSNVSWDHIKALTLELLPRLEEIEETNDLRKIKETKRLVQMFGTVIKYMDERLKNEIDNLEYLKLHNREKQKKMSEAQLRALYTTHAIKKLEKDGIPYSEDNVKITVDHMLQSYIESTADREQENTDLKKEIINRIDDFNPEGLDFDIENPM